MLVRMVGSSVTIAPCPTSHVAEALALVLGDIAPSQRRQIAAAAIVEGKASPIAGAGLFIALREDRLCGAAWGQHQPGNTAVLWPPRLVADEDPSIAALLVDAVAKALDSSQIAMAQVLLTSRESSGIAALETAKFHHLADLLYMTCEAYRFPLVLPTSTDIAYKTYDESQRDRLLELVERTYDNTLDCAALNGVRSMDEVIEGYQMTGTFNPENWLFVQRDGQDVGVLMLADHPTQRHWELMYMGLVQQARGRGLGEQIARYALWLAGQAHVERVVLAVDKVNTPARKMYERVGFIEWDRRTVFVRFLSGRKN